MRKFAVLAACVMALCGSVRASDRKDWFNGGIGADWPADATMSGGAWCKDADKRGHMAADRLQISAEDDEPLTFAATYQKPLGATAAAKSVVIEFSCSFQPFPVSALPEVPADAKGAVILVTELDDPDEAADGTIYYAAWDDVRGKNWWRASNATGVGTGEVFNVTITVAPGSRQGELSVGYILSNRDEVTVFLRPPDAAPKGVGFVGKGQSARLEATYEPGASHTLNLVEIPGLVVTNVTADGESMGSGYGGHAVGDGTDVVVYYAAAPGYKIKDGYDGVVRIGRVTRDTTVDEDTPGIPAVKALGKYQIGATTYMDFDSMNAALKDGDTVEMLTDDDKLPSGATLSKNVRFAVGGYALSVESGGDLTIAADVVFTAKYAADLPSFYINADCVLALPKGTKLGDYSLAGQDYAYVSIGDDGWMRYDGQWKASGMVTMNFYYPGHSKNAAMALSGFLGRQINDGQLDAFVRFIGKDDCTQQYYYNPWTGVYIDDVYWFDGTWSDAEERPVELPTRYVAGDFYPNSTEIVFRITYDMGEVPGATHDNPTGYSIETRFDLGDASADGWAFMGWTDADDNPVTGIDPLELGRESECLYDLTLYASWGPKTSESPKPKAVAVMPGELAAYYDTPESAKSAAAAFNADKANRICAPAGFTGSVAGYAENFVAVAEGAAMSIRLTEDAKSDLAARVDGDTLSVAADLANPAVKMVTVTDAEPGFYYSVLGGTAWGGITKEGDCVLAQKPTVELAKPTLGPVTKAYYKIKAAVKP